MKKLMQKQLTIRQRLTISNILMLALPLLTAVIILLVAWLISWLWTLRDYRSGFANSEDFFIQCEALTDRLELQLEAGKDPVGQNSDGLAELEETLDINNIRLVIQVNGTDYYTHGTARNSDNSFLEAASAMGGSGCYSLNNRNLYARTVTIDNAEYGFYLYGTTKRPVYHGIRLLTIIAIIILLIGLVLTALLSNRFLTRFVFHRIAQPLECLSYGAHQLRDGNLDYHIEYTSEDEFKPVCEDFNEMASQLRDMVGVIQKQDQNRKELLAGISHDLRSPLTAVSAYTDGLIDGVARTEEARLHYLQMIKTKTSDIIHLVSRLFMFSKMDLGEYPIYPEKLRLDEEIQDFLEALGPEYADKGLRLCAGTLEPCTALIDPEQLHCILSNAADNSWKYRDSSAGTLTISVEHRGDAILLTMADDGPGVPEEALPRLFDVFYRGDPARKNPGSGSGIGLAITRHAVELMHGTITARQAVPKGLIIEIQLPALPAEESSDAASSVT